MDYAVFGNGNRPLVIIPGLTLRNVKGSGAGLALMYRCFAKEYRVYIIDKPDDISTECTVVELANHTADAMRILGITKACVFGVSLGGMIAQELAIEHPDLVSQLVLGVTASRPNDTMRTVINRWIVSAQNGNYCDIIHDMLTIMYSPSYVKRYGWLFPLLAKFFKPKNEERFIRLASACLTCSSYDRLEKIIAPTLVLGGEKDAIVTPDASYEIAQNLKCELHLYEGLGHSAYEETPDFNRRMKKFFDDNRPKESTL